MIKKYIFSLFVVSFLSIANAWGATLYFDDNLTGDQDWGNVGNWWTDNASTIQAGSLPSVSDDVVIKANISTNSGAPISVHSAIINDGFWISGISITVVNGATFNGSSINGATLIGDVVFNGTSTNNSDITGDVVFNDSSYNNFDINWDVTFNDSSYNYGGIISGLAVFNGTSRNEATVANAVFNTVSDGFRSGSGNTMTGIVTGVATFNTLTINNGTVQSAVFNGQSYNYGEVSGDAVFNDMGINEYDYGSVLWDAVFNDWSQNKNAVYGDAVFNDSSANGFTVFWNAIFRNTSFNDGTINWNADVYSPSQNPIGGTVLGTITYHNYSSIFPIISSVNSAALYPPGFEVTWTTDVPSTSRVEYGLTDSYGSFSALYITPKNSHTVPISNLLPLTTYHYRIISVGNTGNSTTSGDYVFTIPSGGSGISVPLNQQEDIGTIKFEKGDTENNLPVSAKDIQELIEIPPVSESSINTTVTEQKIETATGGAEPFGTREKTIDIAIKFSGIEVKGVYICQNKFIDTPAPYSCEIAEKAQTAGIISKERETFEPERPVTRIEAYAIFMKSICVAPKTNENNWQNLIIKKAIELGFTTRTIDNFRPNRPISNSEMFALAQKIGEWKKNNPNSCQNK